jgi:hypothetical protein
LICGNAARVFDRRFLHLQVGVEPAVFRPKRLSVTACEVLFLRRAPKCALFDFDQRGGAILMRSCFHGLRPLLVPLALQQARASSSRTAAAAYRWALQTDRAIEVAEGERVEIPMTNASMMARGVPAFFPAWPWFDRASTR